MFSISFSTQFNDYHISPGVAWGGKCGVIFDSFSQSISTPSLDPIDSIFQIDPKIYLSPLPPLPSGVQPSTPFTRTTATAFCLFAFTLATACSTARPPGSSQTDPCRVEVRSCHDFTHRFCSLSLAEEEPEPLDGLSRPS